MGGSVKKMLFFGKGCVCWAVGRGLGMSKMQEKINKISIWLKIMQQSQPIKMAQTM